MMEVLSSKNNRVGIGQATLPDPFQCGREAAQMAKNQLADGVFNLALVFGSEDQHFTDYLEGVRLVTGEEHLIGLPLAPLFLSDLPSIQIPMVALLQLPNTKLSFCSEQLNESNAVFATTSLMTQIKQARGITKQQYDFRGFFSFQNMANPEVDRNIGIDLGLEPWFLNSTIPQEYPNPLICRNRIIKKGIIGFEILSHLPWGVGQVSIEAFDKKTAIYKEGIKSAIRVALHQIQGRDPLLVFLSFNIPLMNEEGIQILAEAKQLIKDTPIIGIPIRNHSCRGINQMTFNQTSSFVAVAIPK
ncbi:MAG: hypothetical protein ACKVQC_09815 [Elusimicrobiota bacterium]